MKLQEKSKETESPVTRSSQPKKKFASLFCVIYSEGSFKKYVRWGGEVAGGHWKVNKNEQGGEGPSACVGSLFKKKMLRFSK